MMDISNYIREGGVMMYVILLLQFPAMFVALATVGFAWMKRNEPRDGVSVWILPAAACGLGVLIIGIGLLGWQMGLSQMEAALQAADPDMVDKMRMKGKEFASYPAIYGSIIGAPTMVAGVLGALNVWRRPKK